MFTLAKSYTKIQANLPNISKDLPGPSKSKMALLLDPERLQDVTPEVPSFWHPNPSCCNQEIEDEDRVKPRVLKKPVGQRAPTQVVGGFLKATLLGTNISPIPADTFESMMFLSPKWDMDEPFPGGVSVSHFVVFADLFWQKKDDSFVDFYGMTQNLFFPQTFTN